MARSIVPDGAKPTPRIDNKTPVREFVEKLGPKEEGGLS
jgi:hypothetical protein